MKVLITCNDDFEANLIIGRLENEGIKAVALNENMRAIYPFANIVGVQVAVCEEDYDRALGIIQVDELMADE